MSLLEGASPHVPILSRFAKGWPRHADAPQVPYAPLWRALTYEFPLDAHFAAYSAPQTPHRLSGEAAGRAAIAMTLFVADVDHPWAEDRDKLSRLPADGFAYETRGGYRLVYTLPTPFPITGDADKELWRSTYLGWIERLRVDFDIHADPACQDWTRLYRLPHTLRDGEMQRLETRGDPRLVGAWTLAPIALPPKETAAAATGADGKWPDGSRTSGLISLAGRLRNEGLGRAELEAVLLAANQERCDPPLPADKVRGMVESAMGWKPARDPADALWLAELGVTPAYATAPPAAPPPPENALAALMGVDLSGVVAPAAAVVLTYGTDIAEFVGEDDPGEDEEAWLVAGLIPAGVPAMIAGPPKSKKTFLALYTAISLAAGRDMFGRKTRRSRVLVIAREDTAREWRRRIWRLARGMGIDPRELSGYLKIDVTTPLYLDQRADVGRLQATLTAYRPAAVFVDNLSRVHLRDENDRSGMALVTNIWADLCFQNETAVTMIHHFIKGTEAKSIGQKIRGTGDLFALVRCVWAVEPVEDPERSTAHWPVHVATDGNLPGLADPFVVRFTDEEREGRKVIVLAAEGVAAKPGDGTACTKKTVLDAFTYAGKNRFESMKSLVGELKRPRDVVYLLVEQLIQEGCLVRDGHAIVFRHANAG